MSSRPLDGEDLRRALEAHLGPVQSSDLAAHLRRDAVFVVSGGVPLVSCGVAVATNDTASVGAWLASGTLRRPSAEEAEAWLASSTRRWLALVVQPFVLVQDLLD